MSPNEFLTDIQKQAQQVAKLCNRTWPVKAGAMAVRHIKENFQQSGFVDNGLKPWKRSKRLMTGDKKARSNYKTLLSSRNHLFSSIRYEAKQGEAIIKNDVVYAAVHNEGLKAGRGAGFTMPKRQFIGESKELTQKLNTMTDEELSKIFNLK